MVVMFRMQLYPTATRQHEFVINFLTARLTEADSLHGERMPDDAKVGHQHSASVPRVPLRVLDAVQPVDENLARPHLHLPDMREDEVRILSRDKLSQHTPARCQI